MKLVLPIASVTAVPNLMLRQGSGEDSILVPATCLCLRAEVTPEILDQLREGMADDFFEKGVGKAPRVPRNPELGMQTWKTEYQGGAAALDLSELEDLDFEAEVLTFTDVDAKAICWENLTKGVVDLQMNAIIKTDHEGRGQLAALLKHKFKVTFSKLTQKPLAEPKKPSDDAANPNQGKLLEDGGSASTTH